MSDEDQVADEELAMCASVLNRIHHSNLSEDRYSSLLKSGRTLFKRQILKDRFGEGDALDFLAEMHGHKLVLKKLEALQREIDMAHASRVDEALNCKINQQREQSMLQIATACEDGDAPGALLIAPTTAQSPPPIAAITDGKSYKYACLGDDCVELFELWAPCLRHMESCAAYQARARRPDAPTCGTNRKMQPSHQLSGAKATKLVKALKARSEVKSWVFAPALCPFHGTHPTDECPKVTGRHFRTGEETGLDFRSVVGAEDCRAIYAVCNGRHYTDPAVLGAAEQWQRTWARRLAEADEAEADADEVRRGVELKAHSEECPAVEELSLQVSEEGAGVGVPLAAEDFAHPELPTREERRLREAGRGAPGQEASSPQAVNSTARIPRGSFRRSCNTCNRSYSAVHPFYHQLCAPCGDFNLGKRGQSADLTGYVCIVTGGRVRIGYEIVLKLLRAGATVLATSRYPQDMALRFSREPDFARWSSRLEAFGPLELADVPACEAFCEAVARRWPRIHVLINNAAQTLTRRTGWAARMAQLEYDAAAKLSPQGRETLLSLPEVEFTEALLPLSLVGPSGPDPAADGDAAVGQAARRLYAHASLPADVVEAPLPPRVAAPAPPPAVSAPSAGAGTAVEPGPMAQHVSPTSSPTGPGTLAVPSELNIDLAHFPAGVLDESRQPLDLSRENSWRQRLGEVSTGEMLHTLAANAVAPFVLCSRLLPLLAPEDGEESPVWGHIINVSALEGKFSVGKKSSGHPHTNMAKAALNMLTCTSASVYKQHRVLMNAVDTGWVTDNAPGGLGPKASKHETHVGPPLDEIDGAARVLDPIFMHVNSDTDWREVGLFWRNYKVSTW